MGICGSKPTGEPKPTASGVSEGVPPDDSVGQCMLTLEGHSDWVKSACFSPGGTKIVSASHDRTVRVCNAATGQCELTLKGHSDRVYSACFSPDGAKIVSASQDNTVRVWDAATGECELTLNEHFSVVYSACFSPDGAKIVSASEDKTHPRTQGSMGGLRVWNAATGERELTLKGSSYYEFSAYSACFSPDGAKIVSASEDGTVRVWNAATGECELTLKEHIGQVMSACFSPDGAKLVSASHDWTVRVWNAATGECERTLEGRSGAVTSASFSPDGAKIVSASQDNTVRVWDVATGECELTLKGHRGEVNSACFSPDGTKFVSGSVDTTVRVWNALTREQVAKAAKAAAPTIAFSVIELTGKELPMTTLSALHTVGELKQEVARASGMRVSQVRLVLKGEVLDDESKTLGECGVEAGSQVNAVSN
jgi:WD40 repeat protein